LKKLKLKPGQKYALKWGERFTKDLKRLAKRKKTLSALGKVIQTLADGKSLSGKQKDHQLKREWQGFRECHIEADWLLIYKIEDDTLYLERSGTHAELFKKP
jgi:mRNA interferase YafQ